MKIEQDIIDYIELIDLQYKHARIMRYSRLSEWWGIWSRKMNLEIRKKIESGKHPQPILLKQIFPYWLIISQLLELHVKHRMTKGGEKRRLNSEAHLIKSEIINGKANNNAAKNYTITQMAQMAFSSSVKR